MFRICCSISLLILSLGYSWSYAADFQVVEGDFTWHEAKSDADARGGRLAVLNTQVKIDLANLLVTSNKDLIGETQLWIGLSDEDNEGSFTWINGDLLTSENWVSGQPDDSGGNEDYVHMHVAHGEWNDHTSSVDTFGYLLEIIPTDTDTDGDGLDDFSLIPAGAFIMGDALDGLSDAPQHTVNVSGFYMGKHEVSWSLWQEVRDWAVLNGYSDLSGDGAGKGDTHPVQNVNWYDVVKWCNAASEHAGLEPVYYIGGAVYRSGESTPDIDYSKQGYRLPTEAEWEKAARGGLSGQRFPWGNTISHANTNYYANGNAFSYDESPYSSYTYHPDYDSGSTPYTAPLGSFAPNAYGLYDMSGNVWEWCNDWYGSNYYSSSPDTDPLGPSEGSLRVRRGGVWRGYAHYSRVANRPGNDPSYRDSNFGFRLALSLPGPQFQAIEGDFTWHEAKVDAEARGGRLAVLDTQAKIDAANAYLDRFGAWPDLYLGLTDEVNEGEWLWLDGSPLTVNNWLSGEPNNSGNEDYAEIIRSSSSHIYLWNDDPGTEKQGYLLEINPPSAPVLNLETFYESNDGDSITIDATPTDGYPTTYSYQWSFKAVGSSSYFVIASNFGGSAPSYPIAGNTGNNGTWKIDVTNATGTTTHEFEYRVIADSDSDGLSDGRETFVLGTDPNDEDSDDDSLLDGVETNTGEWVSASDTGTDPMQADSDDDGLSDGVETNTGEYIDSSDTGTNPLKADTDEDGLSDGAESYTGTYIDATNTGTNPLAVDSDNDGLSDGVESASGIWVDSSDTGTDPTKGDSDEDGLSDGNETNTGTFVDANNTGTDPNNSDSDGDGFTDSYEINTGYDPTSVDETPDGEIFVQTAIEVKFQAAAGGTYTIEHSTDLGAWVTVETGIEGAGGLVERLYSVDDYERRYFRVVRADP